MLKSYFYEQGMEAGLDEAGRGCLAGPVVAAAVILPRNYQNKELRDSKKLSAKQKNHLEAEIKQVSLAWSVREASCQEIDQINILQATMLAMHRAIGSLALKPERLLIDGRYFKKYEDIPYECIIKGDDLYLSIAAASVLAKTYRDRLMLKLSGQYPNYGWESNAGYPTQKHRQAIQEFGLSPWHRTSFKTNSNPKS